VADLTVGLAGGFEGNFRVAVILTPPEGISFCLFRVRLATWSAKK
jgi:hypothetical protein